MVIKRILICFELRLGLKINLTKSVLVGIGCRDELIQSLTMKFSCKAGKLSIFYLGLPIGGNPKSRLLESYCGKF